MINARKLFITVVNQHLEDCSKIDSCLQYKEETGSYLIQYNIGTMHDFYDSQFDPDLIWDGMTIDKFASEVNSMVEEIRLEIGMHLIEHFIDAE